MPKPVVLLQKYKHGGRSAALNKLGRPWAGRVARQQSCDGNLINCTPPGKPRAALRLTRCGSSFEDAFPMRRRRPWRAIGDVKQDMEKPAPMDRLLCGDVGFGKTEVALRAAFKAAADGKQVAVLVPTTILAQQHYNTFVDRFKGFPMRVAVMSRFQSEAEQRLAAAGLKDGSIDVVIGTHRLLSQDIQFKSLGLVVVDEEQRFGVAQKERL